MKRNRLLLILAAVIAVELIIMSQTAGRLHSTRRRSLAAEVSLDKMNQLSEYAERVTDGVSETKPQLDPVFVPFLEDMKTKRKGEMKFAVDELDGALRLIEAAENSPGGVSIKRIEVVAGGEDGSVMVRVEL